MTGVSESSSTYAGLLVMVLYLRSELRSPYMLDTVHMGEEIILTFCPACGNAETETA